MSLFGPIENDPVETEKESFKRSYSNLSQIQKQTIEHLYFTLIETSAHQNIIKERQILGSLANTNIFHYVTQWIRITDLLKELVQNLTHGNIEEAAKLETYGFPRTITWKKRKTV